MKIITVPIVRKFFAVNVGKTAIECNYSGHSITAFANGDQTGNPSLFASMVINEVGDTFVARNDSRTLAPHPTLKDAAGNPQQVPLFLKGETVVRKVESVDFKSFAGNNAPAQFAQGASVYGLNLQVVMQ